MIISFSEFLLEKKLYIFQRKFRIDDLVNSNIYPISDVVKWMDKYGFDKFAHAMLVSKLKLNDRDILSSDDIRISSRDIKNANYFNDETKGFDGYLVDDSLISITNDDLYLYVFRKNSNKDNRARQIHGFKYEGEIKKLNNLTKLPYTDKWDAKGTLDKSFLDNRIESNIEFFDGSVYKNMIVLNDEQNPELDMDIINDSYRKTMFWNIKCITKGNSIDMGDFKRISGINTISNELNIKDSQNIRFFMLNIALHDKSNVVIEEYFIFMPLRVWKEYLPNISDPEIFSRIKEMYKVLPNYRLNGDRTEASEFAWKSFTTKYSDLTKDKVIKLRFKRDSKGQLRIQSSIGHNDFMNKILKNPHIKISK